MRKIKDLIVVLLTLLWAASCSNELSDAAGSSSLFDVEVPLSLQSSPASALVSGTSLLSRSTNPSLVNDTALRNVWILQFIDGNFEKKIYKDTGIGNVFSVKLTNNASGVQSHVYVLANAGVGAFATDPSSEASFLARSLSVPTEEGVQLTGGSLPMLGKFELEVKEQPQPQLVSLERLVARVRLKWDIAPALASELVLTSARVCNVPDALYLTAPTDGSLFPSTPSLYDGGYTDLTLEGTSDSLVYYLPDNRRGTGSNAGGDATGKSGVENATYIELSGLYHGDRVVYHLYPGADDVNDYTVMRNTDYNMNFTLTGISMSDKRVVLPTVNSNSYLVNTSSGSMVYISVKRANQTVELGKQLADLSSGWSSSVLWRDNSLLEIETDDTDKAHGLFKVKINSSGQSGNAVVYIKDGSDNILWSWHIWVTNYDPARENESYNGYTFMNRNLGALNNTAGDAGALGLFYEWGRKDPFAGPSTIAGPTLTPLYSGGSGSDPYSESPVLAPSTSANNLETSVRNPGVYYFATNNNGDKLDWYIGSSSTQNNALWGMTKTVYDPCPFGWKVAPQAAFDSLSDSTTSWDATKRGRTFADAAGSWYPACGFRDPFSGNFGGSGGMALYWTSTAGGGNSFNLNFDPGALSYTNDSGRVHGGSVRCVKEN